MNRGRASAAVLSVLLAVGPASIAGASPTHAPASSHPTICVALVVDFTDLGGAVDSTCARVPKGSTGADVLQAAGHRLTVCSDGIIGEIDGKPANGCQTKDSTHYWSYWHRAPGSSRWVYSTEGAGTYQPGNASTDGWMWQNGGNANRQPADVPYEHICQPASSSPSPAPSRRSSAPVTAATASSAPSPRVTPTRSPEVRAPRQPPTRRHHRVTTPAPTAAAAAGQPTPTLTGSATAVSLARSAQASGGPRWWLVGLVLAAVLALGAAAILRGRQSRPPRRSR